MRNKQQNKIFRTEIITAIIIIFSLFFSSCNYFSALNINSNAPNLPDLKTFTFNASILDNDTVEPDAKSYQNWLLAASKISYWRNFIDDNVQISFALLKYAYENQNFQYYANNTWLYKFNMISSSNNYDVEFYGTYSADSSITWEMYSSVNSKSKMLLVTGICDVNKNQGSWTFFDQQNNSSEVLKIDWLRSQENYSITFYDLNSLDNLNGSNIKFDYISNDTAHYNLLVNVFNSKLKSNSIIKLNSNLFYGSIKSSLNYQDTLWHNWDEKLQDIK